MTVFVISSFGLLQAFSKLMSLEGLLSPLALSVIQIYITRFAPGLIVVCMDTQQKWVRIPLKNSKHTVHDRSKRIFLLLSHLKY